MGANHAQRMVAAGIDVTRGGNIYYAPPEAFTIVDDPKHFCHDPDFDPAVILPGMAASIDEQGVLEAVEVVTDGTKLLVLFGRKRIKHTLIANEARTKRGEEPRKVPYVVFKGDEKDARDRIVIENFHRKIPGPSDYASRIADFRRSGYPAARIAFLLNLDPKGLAAYENLNAVGPDVRQAVDRKELPITAVPTLKDLPRDEQTARVKVFREKRAAGASKASATREAIRQAPEVAKRWKIDITRDGTTWTVKERIRGGKGLEKSGETLSSLLTDLGREIAAKAANAPERRKRAATA